MGQRLTEGDIKKIQAEIEHRKLVVRKEALEDVKEARAHGDLSENFEYKAAKQFKNQNESRIRYLENVLKYATVVSDEVVEGTIGINNTVVLYFPEDDIEETYKVVTSIRSNSLKGMLSIESPLGKAIMKHKVGDVVTVHVNPEISYEVEIRSVDQTTDDADDTIKKY